MQKMIIKSFLGLIVLHRFNCLRIVGQADGFDDHGT